MRSTIARALMAGTLALTVGLFGCGSTKSESTEPQEATEATETTTQQQTQDSSDTKTQKQQTSTIPEAEIDEDQAKQIAFDDAGVAEQDVSLLKVELDYDDGYLKYEVDFHVGATEYEYDIDAVTGDILSRSQEVDD